MKHFQCKYCKRDMAVTFLEYRSNSFCNLCFDERAASKPIAKSMPNNCFTKSKRIHRKMKLISKVGSRLVFLDENDRQLDITLGELSVSLEVGKTYDLELEY